MSEYIVRMPSDMPYEIRAEFNAWYVESEPIVRCGGCRYYDERETSEVYANRHWCDKMTVYMPPNGFCSFGKRRWLTCKCGEEIETTGGAFVFCPNCGARVIAGD